MAKLLIESSAFGIHFVENLARAMVRNCNGWIGLLVPQKQNRALVPQKQKRALMEPSGYGTSAYCIRPRITWVRSLTNGE